MRPYMILVIVLMIIGWIWLFPKTEEPVWIDHGKKPLEMIQVEIIGGVEFPGVYHFFEPITVGEALTYAGSIDDEADLSMLQLSELITSNRQIIISTSINEPIEYLEKLNINKASFKELIEIPGITETRAASIIIYREQHGDFKHLDELIHVKYIGVATLEKIKPYLTL